MKYCALWLALDFVPCILAAPQAAVRQEQQPASTKIEVTAQEVVLDMIVRDKKGRTVRDLKPDEIEILEDGAPQKIRSFRLIEGREETTSKTGEPAQPAPAGLDPLRQVRLVTLVFERLGADGKRFFRQSVQDLLNMSPEPNLYYSVFAIDQRLHLLQNFTNNHDLVKKEAETAQKGAYSQFLTRSGEIEKQLGAMVRAQQTVANLAPGPGQASAGALAVEMKLAQMQLNML